MNDVTMGSKKQARWPWLLLLVAGLGASVGVYALFGDRKQDHEREAIARLQAIYFAQQTFREDDLDHNGVCDYAGSEEALVAAGLIPAWGERAPYRVVVTTGKHAEFVWMASATPTRVGVSGDRCFAVSGFGTIAADTRPIPHNEDCSFPPTALRMELMTSRPPETP